MKNFRIVLLAFASAAFFAACDDAIDITQPSELLPVDTYETLTDLSLGLNGVYGAIPGENVILFSSIFTDEVAIGRSNGGQGLDGGLAFQLTENSGDAASIWTSNYLAINLANRLLVGAEAVVVEGDDLLTKNDILAQARVIRALAHFQLLTYFSTDLTNDSALGVIAMDFVPDITSQLPRNTNGEVFSLIESDLAYADENLIDPAFTVRNKITARVILALRARMAAYRGNYELAKTYVDRLDTQFGITTPTPYRTIWNADAVGPASSAPTGVNAVGTAGSEVIFALARTNSGTTGNFYQFWSSVNSTSTGSPFFEVNRALFNLVNNTGDVRRFVITDPSALIDNDAYRNGSDAQYRSRDVLPVGKYPGKQNQFLLGDVKVFRFSEMAFIRAEYYASIGDITNAVAQINNIRGIRYITSGTTPNPAGFLATPPTTVQGAWAMILDERRAELAFEGHRYIDIKRLGTLAGKGVERDPRDCSFNTFCELPADDHRFTLPIPRTERSANPNIVQNPGY